MRYHVVQFAGDPAALDRDSRLCLELPLLGELAVGDLKRRVLDRHPRTADPPPRRDPSQKTTE